MGSRERVRLLQEERKAREHEPILMKPSLSDVVRPTGND